MLYGEGGSFKWGQLIVKPQAGVVVEHQGYRYGVQLKEVSLISVASSWVMMGLAMESLCSIWMCVLASSAQFVRGWRLGCIHPLVMQFKAGF